MANSSWKGKALTGIGAVVLSFAPGYVDKNISKSGYNTLDNNQAVVQEDNSDYAGSALERIAQKFDEVRMPSSYGGGMNEYQEKASRMEELNKNEQYQKVIDNYKQFADDKGNESGHFFNELGVAYGRTENYDVAIDLFKRSLELRPENAQTLFNLGATYGLRGDYSKALNYFHKAKDINPDIKNLDSWIEYAKKEMK